MPPYQVDVLVRGSEALAKTKDGHGPRSDLNMWQWSPLRDWLSALITPYWADPLLTAVQILMVVVCLILVMAFYTLAERKVIGWMQLRRGPNRVESAAGFRASAQPFADVVKLMFKEILIPADANRFLFRLAPFLSMIPALAIWAVIPFAPEHAFANIDAGLLYVLALTSMGVYGIILAGWAANSKYAFLGAMRSAAQIVAYEIAMGFAMVGVLMAAGSLNIGDDHPGAARRPARAGTGSGCSRCWWCISSPASPRPTARRSTSPRASRRSSPASTSIIPAWRSRCSSSPNTST